jgi:hypothetical protein
MNHARNRSRARLGGLLALALGVAALLAIPVISAARDGSDDGAHHDGAHHGENGHHHRHHHHSVVGTIASFDADSGLLTIDLRKGGSISGLVDGRTKIKCEDQNEDGVHHHRHGGDRGRSGEAEPGDDHGGRGEAEPGDDHGGDDNSGPGNSGRGSHDDNGSGANCTTADLVAGADVQEADLETEHGTRHFDEVELAH